MSIRNQDRISNQGSGDAGDLWRVQLMLHSEKADTDPCLDVEAACILIMDMSAEVALSLFTKLTSALAGKRSTISELSEPELWNFLVSLGTVSPNRPVEIVKGLTIECQPRTFRLPNDELGWTRKVITEILAWMKVDLIIDEQVKVSSGPKKKKAHSERAAEVASAAEVALDGVATSIDDGAQVEKTIFQSSEVASSVTVERKRYPREQLAAWFEKLKQIAELPYNTWTADQNDGLEFLWEENLLDQLAVAAAATGQMELVLAEDHLSFTVQWNESITGLKIVQWIRVITPFLSGFEEEGNDNTLY